jgi:predicted DNA-binding ribbon-helix-helix protein
MTLKKRSVSLGRHKTSIALEPPFWSEVEAMAKEYGLSLAALIARIDAARGEANLASALRLAVLDHVRGRAGAGTPPAAARDQG